VLKLAREHGPAGTRDSYPERAPVARPHASRAKTWLWTAALVGLGGAAAFALNRRR
jgi:hypothetical protein